MRKLVETFPGSGFPKLVVVSSSIATQFTFLGIGPLLFGQPDFSGDLTATAEFGGVAGGNPVDIATSVIMGLAGVASIRGADNDGAFGSSFWEFVDGDTMRMTREIDSDNDLFMNGACAMEFSDFPVDITRGIVTLLGGSQTSASTTLASPVAVGRSAVVFRGNHVLGSSPDPDEWLTTIHLSDVVGDDYTTITAEIGNVSGSNMEIHWTILAFGVNASINVQQHEAIIPTGAASTTNTLSPAVDVAKTVLWPMGPGVIDAGTPARGIAKEIKLTNSTTVTTTRFAGGDAQVPSFPPIRQWFNTLEWN